MLTATKRLIIILALLFIAGHDLFAQNKIDDTFAPAAATISVQDAVSREPLHGVTVQCLTRGCNSKSLTNQTGLFQPGCGHYELIAVTHIGYTPITVMLSRDSKIVFLTPAESILQQVVVSASRGEAVQRSLVPVSIASISSQAIRDTRPTTIDQVLNKISGVNMVNLGNEQHQMSIRQPMSTKSLFLYLEDGIPLRTTGLFNHNALIEMNMAAVKSIEVIKGPSSSLYGSEAIGGVVNLITAAPSPEPVLNLSLQGNNIGYKRGDVFASASRNKWGIVLSGYHADKQNGFLEHSDFKKSTFTARIDYRFNTKTSLSNSLTKIKYISDMPGGTDSSMFANKSFKTLHTFTYRSVDALRYHSTLIHNWTDNSKTTLTALYRSNSIGQNPAYRVKDDYRKQGNSFVGKKDLAHGEINESEFKSYAFIAQHKQKIKWKNALFIGGVNVDLSPSAFHADYIKISKDTITKRYTTYQSTDSLLTKYETNLNNYAAFANFEFSPWQQFRIVTSIRYDLFHYRFNNHLTPSSFSGSPDMKNEFTRISPKVGFTYNFSKRTGVYANYSEGFVPPQVSELYTGVKVPSIKPSVFYNYEMGGWAEVVKNKLSVDLSVYHLKGTDEIISVKSEDGSFINQNAGRTSHKGIEFGLFATPLRSLSFRFSGAYSEHVFLNFKEKGVNYDGNRMNNAPAWVYNTELWFKPAFIPGFRLGFEMQHVGKYYADPQNSAQYEGYNLLNIRAGYKFKGAEIWINLLNATDNYYSNITSKSAFGYSYQVADPRTLSVGFLYDFATLLKKQK